MLYYGELRRRGDGEQAKQLLSQQLKASRLHMEEPRRQGGYMGVVRDNAH